MSSNWIEHLVGIPRRPISNLRRAVTADVRSFRAQSAANGWRRKSADFIWVVAAKMAENFGVFDEPAEIRRVPLVRPRRAGSHA